MSVADSLEATDGQSALTLHRFVELPEKDGIVCDCYYVQMHLKRATQRFAFI
jgi:hypothetical protein